MEMRKTEKHGDERKRRNESEERKGRRGEREIDEKLQKKGEQFRRVEKDRGICKCEGMRVEG